jgi:hypothetical protein
MCRRKERLAFRRPPLAFSARRPRPTHADAGTAAPTTSPFEVEDRASFSFASNPHLHSRLSNLSNLHLPLSFPNSQLPALAIASAHRHPQVVRLPTPFGLPPTPAILSPSLACHSAALQVQPSTFFYNDNIKNRAHTNPFKPLNLTLSRKDAFQHALCFCARPRRHCLFRDGKPGSWRRRQQPGSAHALQASDHILFLLHLLDLWTGSYGPWTRRGLPCWWSMQGELHMLHAH